MNENRTAEFIIDLSEFEKTSDWFKIRFNETIPLGKRIVRCRDCKFCMAYMAGTYCDYMAHSVEPDGFCSWGERKEVDE